MTALKTVSGPLLLSFVILFSCTRKQNSVDLKAQAIEVLEEDVIARADNFLPDQPITITADTCERSEGGIHDFYSEGDYWWPDPENPDAPYVQKDGLTNPENFIAHRESLMRFSEIVGTLTSAFLITKKPLYAESALKHCKAWFIDQSTRMNPSLLYSQAIKGRYAGRDIGVIDAIHFMDVAQSLKVLESEGVIEEMQVAGYKAWFSSFLEWLTTHPYGLGERNRKNNHATWWNTQVASYADYVGNSEVMQYCIENYKTNLLPNQMDTAGSFPEEINRTKPYSYMLFNLDAMAMFCLIASDEENDLWAYEIEGKSIAKGLAYMAPFVAEKATWPLEPDVQYWDYWPVAHPAYLAGALAYENQKYFQLWKENKHFLAEYEIRRTVANKSPVIWLSQIN